MGSILRIPPDLVNGPEAGLRRRYVGDAFFGVAEVLLQMGALMSVSVGILNLLPIPVLDGGHLLSYAYEAVVRRPPAVAVQMVGYRAGLALLVGLMLFATWNDLGRQQVFHFFGS